LAPQPLIGKTTFRFNENERNNKNLPPNHKTRMLSTIKSCDREKEKKIEDDKEERKKRNYRKCTRRNSLINSMHGWFLEAATIVKWREGRIGLQTTQLAFTIFFWFLHLLFVHCLAFSFRPSYFVLWHFDSRKIAWSEGWQRGGGESSM
jgi:hypothetical protein